VPALTTPLKFSLVLATIGRTAELSNFLMHLDCQSYRNFELIVVDQNPDDRLAAVLAPYRTRFAIKHLKSGKGLSRARNVGLRHISGDIVAFPDDDCWYHATTLQQVASLFLDHSDWDGATGGAAAPWAERYFDQKKGFLHKYNAWRRTVSITIFLRSSVVRAVGDFDPMLGAGSALGYGSSEEIDYVLRALEEKFRICYVPDLLVHHPTGSPSYDHAGIRKGYSYACGAGYTYRKHRFPVWYFAYLLFRSFAGVVLSAARANFPKANFHWALLRGRLSGWMSDARHDAGSKAHIE